jgi:hypothetical protein
MFIPDPDPHHTIYVYFTLKTVPNLVEKLSKMFIQGSKKHGIPDPRFGSAILVALDVIFFK